MKRRAWNSTLSAPSRPMPKVNRQRQARRQSEGRVYGSHHRWVRNTHVCLLHGREGHTCTMPMDGHHVLSVGAGGEDAGNVVPLCRGAHRLDETSVHVMGRESFEAYWRVDLDTTAWELWAISPYSE